MKVSSASVKESASGGGGTGSSGDGGSGGGANGGNPQIMRREISVAITVSWPTMIRLATTRR